MNKLQAMFMPHPPILLSEIGNGKEYLALDTLNGLNQLGKRVSEIKPDTIIFITPHGNSFSNGTCFLYEENLQGDFRAFGSPNIKKTKRCNQNLSNELLEALDEQDIIGLLLDEKTANSYGVEAVLDHGGLVPMYFIDKYYKDYRVVVITPGSTPREENYQIGKLMAQVIASKKEKILVVCSGDLSHALKDDGPYHYSPASKVFDETVQKALREMDPLSLIQMNPETIHEAAQCGLNSFLIGLGLFDGLKAESEVLSYEGPFGVGYLTGMIEAAGFDDYDESNSVMNQLEEDRHKRYNQRVGKEDDYIRLARLTIERYVKTKQMPTREELISIFSERFIEELEGVRRGAFVSIHKDHQLRGCIGTLEPSSDNLMEEIIYCAISAASSDPRFNPIESLELYDIEVKVDVLLDSEIIKSRNELDTKTYGVIVEKDHKRGVLLPNLDGIDSIDEQIRIAMQKAGITNDLDMVIKRFKVIRHEV